MSDLVPLGKKKRREPKPPWLKVPLPSGERYKLVKATLEKLNLHTVCKEASCPNVGECWSGGTATVMLMGEICTRGCRFCNVDSGRPGPLDPDEPKNLATAVSQLGIDYVVVTSVDRDDLPDGGAAHFAEAIIELKTRAPTVLVEVLIPDFQGDHAGLDLVAQAGADVVAHNIETVERLQRTVRDARASYRQSLDALAYLKERGVAHTKSSIQVGLGESDEEVLQTMRDLRSVGVELVTLGQYLRPSPKHLPVVEFAEPARFEAWQRAAEEMGFAFAASGSLVRSSYRAGELFIKARLGR